MINNTFLVSKLFFKQNEKKRIMYKNRYIFTFLSGSFRLYSARIAQAFAKWKKVRVQ